MPLREFPIGPVGEELYPKFVAGLAEALDYPGRDRNVVVRDALAQLYSGRRRPRRGRPRSAHARPFSRFVVVRSPQRHAGGGVLPRETLEKWARVAAAVVLADVRPFAGRP